MNDFIYFNDKEGIINIANSKNMRISSKIDSKHLVFDLYCNSLNFPDYFGFNWDALYDCLTDLDWIEEYEINLIHEDIPLHQEKIQCNTYISLLSDVV